MAARRKTKQSGPQPRLTPILMCFFLSGVAGLIYEVAWAKALGMIFGHTTYAIATVLAVFMAGLAAGSAYLGRWAERKPAPIALYARIEFMVGVTGALSLLGLTWVRALYVAAYPALGGSQPPLLALRFVGAAIVLLIPTFLMGGTLPILVSGIARNSAELGFRVSQLYWVNTAGAVVGTLVSGFVLLPSIGLRLTIVAAAVINVVAGFIAIRISARTDAAPIVPHTKAASPAPESLPLSSRFLFVLFGVVGCTAFAYEIAWTRQLAITIGSSTYAFTLMLATFLLGTVLGSALFQRFFAHSSRISIVTLSRTQRAIAVAAVAALILFHWIPAIIPALLRVTDQSFFGVMLAQFVTAALTLLPVATLFGFNFPLVVALIDCSQKGRDGTSTTVGRAYAANTVGAIVGSLITGFWLISLLGSFRVIVATAVVNVLLVLILDFREPRIRPLAFDFAAFLIASAVGFSSFFYNQSLLSFSAVLYGNSYDGRLTLGEMAATKDLIFSSEGANASVAVVRTDNDVALRINGKVDASTDDARTQFLLGHLGAAFHPAPRRVLIIGFGSGMTASAVAHYPDIERIDCVEIEPAVLKAAPYLESLNRNVLKDPRLRLIFDDARNFLLTTNEKYDLIISEPSNPWIAGIATLFTDEFYAAARNRLAPGGVVVQWVQAYSIAPDDLRMIVASFSPHFSEVTLWRAGETDLLLLGRTDASPFRFDHLRSLWDDKSLRDDFESLDVREPEGLMAYFLLDDAAVRRLAQVGRLNTDDRTLLEYDAPRSLLARSLINADEELISGLRERPLPANLDPAETSPALESGALTALDINDIATAEKFVQALESQPLSPPSYIAKGRLDLIRGDLPNAKSALQSALKLDPDSLDAMHWLAILEHKSGDEISARSYLDEILKRNPRFLPALKDQMEFALDQKDYRAALLAQMTRIAVMSDVPASEYCRLGAMWATVSNFAEAESALFKGLLKDPYSYSCHVELGAIYGATGRLADARTNLEWAIRFFPAADAANYRSLAAIDNALGDSAAARETLQKGQRIFPGNDDLHKAGNLPAR